MSPKKKKTKKDRFFMKVSSTPYIIVQRCFNPLYQNQCPLFLLPPLSQKISKTPAQDQQSGIRIWNFQSLIPLFHLKWAISHVFQAIRQQKQNRCITEEFLVKQIFLFFLFTFWCVNFCNLLTFIEWFGKN